MKPRICVDFDGTIFDGKGIFPGCIEALSAMRQTFWVAIYSARQTGLERAQMTQILEAHGVPFDEILPPKPEAMFYIDDKGRRFEGWDKLVL